MPNFFGLLCVIQVISSLTLHIPKFEAFSSIDQAMAMQDGAQINGSLIRTAPSSTPDVSNGSSTLRPTDSTKAPTQNVWSVLKEHLAVVVAIAASSLICVICTLCVCCYCQKKRRKSRDWKRLETPTHDTIELSTISRPTSTTRAPSKLAKKRRCPYMELAKEFVNSLGWNSAVFDSTHDKCYCTKCYPDHMEDVSKAGNAEYVIPRGWARIGLFVDPAQADQHDIWRRWIVTFHGTSIIAAQSILANRQFCLPGDTLIDGTILGIREGHIPDKKHIYTSPTIAYSSLPVYSAKIDFHSSGTSARYHVQIVLQCRQAPNKHHVQGETVGAGHKRICRHVTNDKLEYFTVIRASLVAYGLLVRVIQP